MNDLIGLNIQPDEWRHNFAPLEQADSFTDSSFPGCEYRLPCKDYSLAVNITITGRKSHDVRNTPDRPWYKTRVRIEFVGDSEPSTFTGAWIFSPYPLVRSPTP